MASTFEDTVFDFDLNFLRHTANNTGVNSKFDKQRKALIITKKKTIATDSLIKKYYAKKELLDQTERNLLSSKEECKQICIDYKNALEKCAKLELDVQTLQRKNQELETKSIALENRYEAIQCHSNQLQQLLKDKEIKIEAFKIENQLEKTTMKNFEKSVASLEKEKSILMKHIQIISEVTSGKKKLNSKSKLLLERYRKISDKTCTEALSEEDNCDIEADIYDDPIMSPTSEAHSTYNAIQIRDKFDLNMKNGNGTNHAEKRSLIHDDIDQDSDCSHELVSVDTGRGSSLAFSESDKCFHSPDYFINDSPISTEVSSSKDNRTKIDVGTSPVTVVEKIDVSTSPIQFEHCEYPLMRFNRKERNFATDLLSPIDFNTSNEKETTPIITINDTLYEEGNESGINLQEKECLELNNSQNLIEDSHVNSEVAMILNIVKVPYRLMTPIPSTPAKSCSPTETCPSTSTFIYNEQTSLVCQDAAKVWEQNKVLRANIIRLSYELVNIKETLKNFFSQDDQGNNESSKSDNSLKAGGDLVRKSISKQKRAQKVQSKDPPPSPQQNVELLLDHVSEIQDDTLSVSSNGYLRLNLSQNLHFEKEPEFDGNNAKENISETRKSRNKKMTKLDKMRKKMLPKSKIQRANRTYLKRMRTRPKQLLPCKKKVTNSDSAASLNDKDVYENAVKVMSELNKLNSEKKANTSSTSITNKLSKRASTQAIITNSKNITCEETVSCRAIITRRRLLKESKDANANHTSCEVVQGQLKRPSSFKSSITTRRRASTQSKSADGNNTSREELDVNSSSLKCSITTRSRGKRTSVDDEENNMDNSKIQKKDEVNITKMNEQETRRKLLKRASCEKSEIECKRILRSSSNQSKNNIELKEANNNNRELTVTIHRVNANKLVDEQPDPIQTLSMSLNTENHCNLKDYSDLNLFTDDDLPNETQCLEKDLSVEVNRDLSAEQNPRKSVLIKMIEKYGVFYVKNTPKKISDSVINSYAKKIEEGIAQIIDLPPSDVNKAMNDLVHNMRCWSPNHFLTGLIKYLKDPLRKVELFNKVHTPPAPPMTKSEQILLFIVTKLRKCWSNIDIVDCILNNIEYTLFRLNRTPEFDTIESMSHFYAVLCRYIEAKSRLRLFILDAMYCIQFKSVPLIKQCLDVWMQILPLAHMGVAKSPLVTCLVYLLHFFKCEDKFNRVLTLRNIISQKYFYQITEWNDSKILEMFRTSIMEIREDVPIEAKMLRLALIILAKRQGTRWCQKNILKNLLQPMIEKENVPEKVKLFCVSMMGPLLKPYPVDMKVHCEIVMNQLIDMLDSNPSQNMQEAILTSLIYMSKHNQNRVIQVFLSWNPKKMSPDIESMLKHYVREKPVKVWKAILSKISINQ